MQCTPDHEASLSCTYEVMRESGEHDDVVMDSNRTALYDPGTDATASFERPCHSGLGQPLYVPADRAWPYVLKGRPADPEPPKQAQVPEVYAAEDYVAPVLAVADADARLLLYGVEILCSYQGDLAHPAEAGPVSGALAIAVSCEPAPCDSRNLPDALHRFASSARYVDPLYRTPT